MHNAKDIRTSKRLPDGAKERVFRTQKRGALLRSVFSAFFLLFAFIASLVGAISNLEFLGISSAVVFLIILGAAALPVYRRIYDRRLYEFFTILFSAGEIFGYTVIIYFSGGVYAGYLSLLYVFLIVYAGVAAPKRYPFIFAGISCVLYDAMVLLQYRDILPNLSYYSADWPVSGPAVRVFLLNFMLLVIAFISSNTSNILKKGREKLREQNDKLNRMVDQLRLAKEAADEASHTKSRFLANMSHEIRTPMTGLLGMIELLLKTELSAKQRSYAEASFRSGRSLLAIINGVLDLSKIEEGKLILSNVPFPIRDVMEDAVELFAETAPSKGIDLSAYVSPAVPLNLIGDPQRIKQILTNLIGNAIKFTAQGEVSARVRVLGVPGSEATLRFEVKDTGIGIPSEYQSSIFDTFVQADETTTRKYGGTGLGLAIVQRLVKLMGGRVGLESNAGQGSLFWFELTLGAGPGQTEAVLPPDLHGKRILVAENNDTNRALVADYLRHWGADCTTAHSGRDALAVLQSGAAAGQDFDLAVIAMDLPVLEGAQPADLLLPYEGIQKQKVVLMAPLNDFRDSEIEKEFGKFRIIHKPVRLSALRETIREAIEERPFIPDTSPDDARPKEREASLNLRILLVEDSEVNQLLALEMLDLMGCEVQSAVNGVEALNLLERNRYDLVMMDCQMPEMDGYEATRRFRRIEAANAAGNHSIPIIALTAHALKGDREKCLQAGMNDYLLKPFKYTELRGMVEKWAARQAEPRKQMVSQKAPQSDESNVISQVLDMEVVDELRLLGRGKKPSLLQELIDVYLDRSPALLQLIQSGADEGNVSDLESGAHKLKSCSGNLGGMRLYALCNELEESIRNGHLQDPRPFVAKIEREYERVRAALADLKNV